MSVSNLSRLPLAFAVAVLAILLGGLWVRSDPLLLALGVLAGGAAFRFVPPVAKAGRLLGAAVVLALAILAFSPPPLLFGDFSLRIEGLAEKSGQGKGGEVWLREATASGGSRIPLGSFTSDGNWERRPAEWVFHAEHPAVLSWRGRTAAVSLRFGKHPWSGLVRISSPALPQPVTLDLYAAEGGDMTLRIGADGPGVAVQQAVASLAIAIGLLALGGALCRLAKALLPARLAAVLAPAPGAEALSAPAGGAWVAPALCGFGMMFSLLAFFPGWMTSDSFTAYNDALNNMFNSWNPVLLGWWWRKLDFIYKGPALMLVQDLAFYWGGFWLVARGARRWLGRWADLLPLVGLWPALLFPLGEIWKDMVFATSLFFAWGLLINRYARREKPLMVERLAVFVLAFFGFGVKTNGLVVLPFLFGFWILTEGWLRGRWIRQGALNLALTAGAVAVASVIVPASQVIKMSPLQYTQSWDTLAISIQNRQNLMPAYFTDKIGTDVDGFQKYYAPCDNNFLFLGGGFMTNDTVKLGDLQKHWIAALLAHPRDYLTHRQAAFRCLLRWPEFTPAYIADPGVTPPEWGVRFGVSFTENRFSRWLAAQPQRHPWMFLPWIDMIGLAAALGLLVLLRWQIPFVFWFGGSAVSFILPHFFIAPAADYRYFFYAYLCTFLLMAIAPMVLLRRLLGFWRR